MKLKALLILSVLSFCQAYSMDNNKSWFEKTKQWTRENKELIAYARGIGAGFLSVKIMQHQINNNTIANIDSVKNVQDALKFLCLINILYPFGHNKLERLFGTIIGEMLGVIT